MAKAVLHVINIHLAIIVTYIHVVPLNICINIDEVGLMGYT